MSHCNAITPIVFLARHGETERTISGQHTGISDIPLTARGERQVIATAELLIGTGKLLDPQKVQKVFISPRQRATRTFELLFGNGVETAVANQGEGKLVAGVSEQTFGGGSGSIEVTERIAEWDYGEYYGITPSDTVKMRQQMGLDKDKPWSIWRDGAPGGESKEDIERRLDGLIQDIQDMQEPYMNGGDAPYVVLVAHGLIGRCFILRWLKMPVDADLPMIYDPGAIVMLSYKGQNVKKTALVAGMAIPCD